jgi:UDP-glucose 4-epimerase
MEPLQSKRCVVLGGGGFIGTNLCRRLAGRVAALRVFGRSQSFPDALDGIEWIRGDFNDSKSLSAAIEGCDVVFHLLNSSTPASSNADKVADLNGSVVNTLRLLEACCAQGKPRVVFVSSGGTVYGVTDTVPTREDSACWPISAYGVSKLTIERYLHLFEYIHQLDYRILRVSNPFGAYQTVVKNQGVIAAFVRRVIAGRPLEVWGDGTVSRDYLYVDDVVEALEAAALHEGPERVFNIGSGLPRSLNEIIEALQVLTGVPLQVDYRDARRVDVPITALDITRARSALGWSPRTPFLEGLERTFAWTAGHMIQSSPIDMAKYRSQIRTA